MAMIRDLNADSFDETIASGVVLVDFWAPWCSSCKMLGAILEQVAVEAAPEIVIGKVNVDENRELAAKLEVTSLPHVFIYKDGKVVKDFATVMTKSKLLDLLANA